MAWTMGEIDCGSGRDRVGVSNGGKGGTTVTTHNKFLKSKKKKKRFGFIASPNLNEV